MKTLAPDDRHCEECPRGTPEPSEIVFQRVGTTEPAIYVQLCLDHYDGWKKRQAPLAPRVVADLFVIACLFGSGVFARAFAEAAAQTSFGIALINQLPAIMTSAAALIIGIWTLIRQGNTHEAVVLNARVTESVKAETVEIKKDVNSQFAAMQAKVRRGEEEIAALKREIASRPGSTTEEKVRADVATEHVRAKSAAEEAGRQ